MSLTLNEKDRKEVHSVFDRYKSYDGFFDEFIKRWNRKGNLYSEKILRSLKRQVDLRATKTDDWKSRCGVGIDLEWLFMKISFFLRQMKEEPIRPSERQEAIERIGANSAQIIRDMAKIGLPFGASHYFTSGEVECHFIPVLRLLGLSDLVDESQQYDWDAFGEIVRSGLMPDTPPPKLRRLAVLKELIESEEYESHDEVGLLATELLVKLTNARLLDQLAKPADVSKIKSDNYERVFMIRKLHQYFLHQYGEGLQQTTANLCVLIFDDESIDRESVRSALTGFEPKPEYAQPSFGYHLRIRNILELPNCSHLSNEFVDRFLNEFA